MKINIVSLVPPPVTLAIKRIEKAGGKAFLVGGAVIDIIQGREPKDWDIEIFGLKMDHIAQLFSEFNPQTVGKAFGVIKVNIDGFDLDLNLPRLDNKVGVGHKGFDVVLDPNMSLVEAARRRDFTINTLSMDLRAGQVHDPFGGLADLKAGILRVTDPVLFAQDPLRALRAMQLLARKARGVDKQTMSIIQGMTSRFHELPKERIHVEFQKLLLKAKRPSMGFRFLRASKWIQHFPELEALIDCPQNPEWHPEGDVWTHTLLAVDAAAQVRHLVPAHQREAFMFAVLCHDFGKPATTITPQMIRSGSPWLQRVMLKTGRSAQDLLLTAYGHDVAGIAPTESFLRRMTNKVKLIKLVSTLVGLHMQPYNLVSGNAGKSAFLRLQRKLLAVGGDLTLLARLGQCDAYASGPNRKFTNGQPTWEHHVSQKLLAVAQQLAQHKIALRPKVRGKDLINLGLKPGPHFKDILARALEIQDDHPELTKDQILNRLNPRIGA